MNHSIPIYPYAVPTLSTEQMIEVDRLMIEEYKIELIQMMENAGRCLAIVAKKRFLGDEGVGKKVAVLAGTGGNGGGALVGARRLSAWGFEVEVYLASQEKMTPVPDHQLGIVRRMGLPIHNADDFATPDDHDLIIDGVIGYSIQGDPRGAFRTLIDRANESKVPTLSLDTPSGIDLTSGTVHTPSVQAEATLTLALPKRGLYDPLVQPLRGELYLGDLSVPPSLYARPSLGMGGGSNLRTGRCCEDRLGILKVAIAIKKH